MQTCIHPPTPGDIDANLHRSPQGWWDGCKFASMDLCTFDSIPTAPGGIDANLYRPIDANLHRSPWP